MICHFFKKPQLLSEKSAPPPYSEPAPPSAPPSGYGQPYPIQGQPYSNQNQPVAGQNLAQPYPAQQALSNNSKVFSKNSCTDFFGPSFMKFENSTKGSQ